MIDIIKNNPLFKGLNTKEIEQLLECLNSYKKEYKKNQTIIRSGEKIHSIGILIKGEAHITRNDYWGNSSIITHLYEGEVFGEAYACVNQNDIGVNVIACQDSEVLFLDISYIIKVCPHACHFHHLLLQNLLEMIAKKNIILNHKLSLLSKKTMREKIISYLSSQAIEQGSKIFDIPYNRQQLADYLGVDRSALSSELSRMQKDGIISYYKHTFKLLQ